MAYGPIVAKVNNKVTGLGLRLYRSADIEYLDSWAFDAVAACDGINLIPLRSDLLLMPMKMLSRGELADAVLRFALFRGDIAR